jgi:ferredoxin
MSKAGPEQPLEVWIDQDLCTGDGLCAQYAPMVFELDLDGLAYVKGAEGDLRTDSGATAPVPPGLVLEVIDSAKECPGECIHVRRAADRVEVAGPDAGPPSASSASPASPASAVPSQPPD